MKKILVLGANGMAGSMVFNFLTELGDYEVYGVVRNRQQSERFFILDVSNTAEIKKIIDLNFDVIINCIGILNSDAENNPSKAIWINSYFPHFLELHTKNSNSKVITISTDCVFSGKQGMYSEKDFKDGESVYALSKALGELVNEKDLTIRTSIIGPELNNNGIGLFHWFMHQKGEIDGYTTSVWGGVTTLELAKFIHHVMLFPVSGLVHLTNGIPVSKFDLLSSIKSLWNRNVVKINPFEGKLVDKSLKKSEKIDYQVPGYEEMLKELRDWMKCRPNLFKYI
jgi:dTDP-4-dehydrorhamnose reductase